MQALAGGPLGRAAVVAQASGHGGRSLASCKAAIVSPRNLWGCRRMYPAGVATPLQEQQQQHSARAELCMARAALVSWPQASLARVSSRGTQGDCHGTGAGCLKALYVGQQGRDGLKLRVHQTQHERFPSKAPCLCGRLSFASTCSLSQCMQLRRAGRLYMARGGTILRRRRKRTPPRKQTATAAVRRGAAHGVLHCAVVFVADKAFAPFPPQHLLNKRSAHDANAHTHLANKHHDTNRPRSAPST